MDYILSALREVAASVDGPAYVYFIDTIQERCRQLRRALGSCDPLILFAMKANSSKAVVQSVLAEVDGLECVSLGEVLVALRLGAKRLLYTNNNVSSSELAAMLVLARVHAPSTEVWINCDSVQRLAELPEGSDAFLRINGPIGAGHHAHVVTCGPDSKFGIHHESLASALELARVSRLLCLPLLSLISLNGSPRPGPPSAHYWGSSAHWKWHS